MVSAEDVIVRSQSPETVSSGSAKHGKESGGQRVSGSSSVLKSVNRSTSQIRKHPHRRSGSPLDWFPRKKTDSFLKRKIKLLQQEVGGMNLSLDETLGGANPHYSRMAREKIAAKQAALKAMAARKAALVEASWCRILKAARIQTKEAEAELMKAEKCASLAFEAAAAMGVMMYDRPDCPKRPCEVQTSSGNGGSTHTVTASFETAFDVDKEVAAAVKKAFIKLVSCSSSNEEEFRNILRKISENPDDGVFQDELPPQFSESESELDAPESTCAAGAIKNEDMGSKTKKYKNEWLSITPKSKNFKTFTELVDMMLGRLRCLEEDDLSSLATIVATCGLNAALLETESGKRHHFQSGFNVIDSEVTFPRRMSSIGHSRRKAIGTEVLSLDKYLVKHVSKLEREVLEARNKKDNVNKNCPKNLPSPAQVSAKSEDAVREPVSGLGGTLTKHVELEGDTRAAEVSQEANQQTITGKSTEASNALETGQVGICYQDTEENDVASESSSEVVQQMQPTELQLSENDSKKLEEKENVDSNKISTDTNCLQSPLVFKKHMSRIEKAKLEAMKAFSMQDENGNDGHIGLDKIFVKKVHRLEKEKMQASEQCNDSHIKEGSRRKGHGADQTYDSLDKVLVKHVSKLEREKLAALQTSDDSFRHVGPRQRAKEKERNEVWGGHSLENSIRPHLSRLEREKAAWRKAEEEQRAA